MNIEQEAISYSNRSIYFDGAVATSFASTLYYYHRVFTGTAGPGQVHDGFRPIFGDHATAAAGDRSMLVLFQRRQALKIAHSIAQMTWNVAENSMYLMLPSSWSLPGLSCRRRAARLLYFSRPETQSPMLPKTRRKNFATGGGRSTTTITTTAKPRRSTAKKANYVEPQTTTDKDKPAASVDYDALDDLPTGHLAKKTRTTPES
ncbi:hypothetical protein QBC32DRAFT_404577 [Pseudoneurospora amorphoporcata]|uniref:Uncharacterized protein n=1 Tax=Pseudoneurospora amorphoporcata TaxID=241081 RepID=A0AAN6NZK0_9PEZI|nr:hypothetical protein QBC32DRAFT_404577 [Pseudoneurospora amorphoporcata]